MVVYCLELIAFIDFSIQYFIFNDETVLLFDIQTININIYRYKLKYHQQQRRFKI